jgi:malonyl CoA-acyl carrier protein transacylase
MTTMTVTEALAELTLLEKRIRSALDNMESNKLIAVVEVEKVPIGFRSRAEHATQARAILQQVNALIARRRLIKRQVVMSNATTHVTIAGEAMTVAEAIEMKNFIAAYESVATTLNRAYDVTRKEFEFAQMRVKERLDKLATEVLGRREAVSSEQYQSFVDGFMARQGVELLDPVNLAMEVEQRQAFIEEFKSAVDRVLSISNARTTIEVPD